MQKQILLVTSLKAPQQASHCLGVPSNSPQGSSRALQGLGLPFSGPSPTPCHTCSASAALAFGPSPNKFVPTTGPWHVPFLQPGILLLTSPQASPQMSLPGRNCPGHMLPLFAIFTAVIIYLGAFMNSLMPFPGALPDGLMAGP